MSRLSRSLIMLVAVMVLTGCHPAKTKGLLNTLMARPPLKVGITTDYPPLAYKKDAVISGLETEFATGLAKSVERRLELVALPRTALAKALLEGKVDIVMAGMTVVEAHNQKLATTNPYLVSGQVALVHLNDFKQLGTGIRNLAGRNVRLGVVEGSSGENLIRGLKPTGTTSRFASASEGVQALIADKIDVFIFDLPANYYYAALYVDKGLTPGVAPLTREPLAWAIRPSDDAMRKAANTYLADIEKNGTLHTLIERALPFYRNTAYSPKQ
jgi:polar amino acid transport system substrate-binding protein